VPSLHFLKQRRGGDSRIRLTDNLKRGSAKCINPRVRADSMRIKIHVDSCYDRSSFGGRRRAKLYESGVCVIRPKKLNGLLVSSVALGLFAVSCSEINRSPEIFSLPNEG
jgi:hypothetical protein